MADSYYVKQFKKLEKLDSKIENKYDWDKVISGKIKLSEQAELVINTFDDITTLISETLAEYERIVKSLDIQALADDE